MKFIFDTDKIEKFGINGDTFIYLISLYLKCPITEDTFIKANKQGYTIKHESTAFPPYTISKQGIFKTEQHFLNSEMTVTSKGESLEDIANAMREVYPSGRKAGTNYMWRDSTAVIAQRLKALVKKYNVSFTKEEAVDATRRYIAGFNGNYTYMQILKYFISKQKPVEGAPAEQNSQFLSYLENKEGDTIIASPDWTVNLL